MKKKINKQTKTLNNPYQLADIIVNLTVQINADNDDNEIPDNWRKYFKQMLKSEAGPVKLSKIEKDAIITALFNRYIGAAD